ncbi:hypothetical protein SAMN04488142_1425 [Halomonas sp. hl-4]|nr:hypothetical protein SAMN04488142_1425 [Halomonas sp. hl-4]
MIDTLINAIRERKEIEFTYSGLRRTGQPATIGVSTSGNEVLRIYQTVGGHVHPNHEWDLCYVSDLSNIRVTDSVFLVNPPGYRKGDRGMSTIYEEL